jgi:hypothetical protein
MCESYYSNRKVEICLKNKDKDENIDKNEYNDLLLLMLRITNNNKQKLNKQDVSEDSLNNK